MHVSKRKIVYLCVIVLALAVGFSFWNKQHQEKEEELAIQAQQAQRMALMGQQSANQTPAETAPATEEAPKAPPPPPPSMDKMKKKGCVADGLLNGYGGDTGKAIKMINSSECEYLHRSIETWLAAPDFKKIKKYKEQITKPGVVYGMFIAEALSTKEEYYYPDEDRDFDFSKMCKPGSDNKWGEHTCVPSLDRKEYRKYVRYITQQAMDQGVQSFMFGQVYYQDDVSDPKIPEVIEEMKQYAASLGMEIVVGAQTNDITDEKYLQKFDYIEGGVGIDSQGEVEDGACFSRWWKQPGDWCWALLWHKDYSSKAKNVFLHLDWSGKKGDDMSTFALMDDKTRVQTLSKLYKKFTSDGDGFLMPVLAVLPKDNGGCYGPKKGFYSPNDRYKCKDEDEINNILKGKK